MRPLAGGVDNISMPGYAPSWCPEICHLEHTVILTHLFSTPLLASLLQTVAQFCCAMLTNP